MTINPNKVPGLCVFCASDGVTREHIWPDWLKKVIPRSATTGHVFNRGAGGRYKYKSIPVFEIKRGSGDIYSQKLKIVCKPCNSGWMSQLQERTKPLLVPLITGKSENFDFNPLQSHLLSSWAMMFTMVVEFRDWASCSVTFDERNAFRSNPAPNRNWMIWIGKNARKNGSEPWSFSHYSWHELDGPVPEGVIYKHSSQTTTFVVGRLVFHTYSTRSASIVPSHEGFGLEHGMRPIWPLPDPGLAKIQATLPPMTPKDIHDVSRSLINAVDSTYLDLMEGRDWENT